MVHRVRTGLGTNKFETSLVRRLYAGDGNVVDSGYDYFMKQFADQWDERHETRDPRAVATFGFARHNRDPQFRNGIYSWVRSTMVCIDDDPADDVIVERVKHYFPEGASVAVHCREASRMKFSKVGAGSVPDDSVDVVDGALTTATGYTSMGMMVDTIYRGDDWIDDAHPS